jgi:hypothetical protein
MAIISAACRAGSVRDGPENKSAIAVCARSRISMELAVVAGHTGDGIAATGMNRTSPNARAANSANWLGLASPTTAMMHALDNAR